MSKRSAQARRRQKRARKDRRHALAEREALEVTAAGRMCLAKTTYRTKAEAVAAAAHEVYRSPTGYMRAYSCPVCGRWHLTTHPPSGHTLTSV